MKKVTTVIIFSLLMFQFVFAQCDRSYFVVSPSLTKYSNAKMAIGIDAGFLPVSSLSFASIKTNFWTEEKRVVKTNAEGVEKDFIETRNNSFVALKLSFVPNAFENKVGKWMFSSAAGVVLEDNESVKPGLETSGAYIIRMPSGSYNGGTGYLKLEGGFLIAPHTIKPFLGAGVILLF